MKYPNIKRLKLSHAMLASALGFKTVASFRASSAHKRYMQAFETVLELVKEKL